MRGCWPGRSRSSSADVAYLQGNLIINPLATSVIRNSGVSLEQIVSIDLAGDGGGVIYANDL
jgi:hypothetical protein